MAAAAGGVNKSDIRKITTGFADYARELPDKLEVKFWKWAAKLANAAKRHCPVETGIGRASIHEEVTHKGGELVGAYGTNKKHLVYIEFGTRAHLIRAKGGGLLRFKTADGHWVSTREVRHPGIEVGTPEVPRTDWPAKRATHTMTPETMPFMRVAWVENRDALIADLKSIGMEVKG